MPRALRISEAPPGFDVIEAFLTPEEERALLAQFDELEFGEVRMHGVAAKRVVHHFGWSYGYESWRIAPTEPLPAWLLPFRDRAAAWAGIEPDSLEQCLVARYPPGAGIGWHRDAPMFGPLVIGISLGGACRFRLRREIEGAMGVYEAALDPRSAYLLGGEARSVWQHHVPPVKACRYSISLRTVRNPDRWKAPAPARDGDVAAGSTAPEPPAK